MRRHALGIIALGLIVGGVAIWMTSGELDGQSQMAAGVCLRAGLVLAALWLAFPQVMELLVRFPPWLIGTVIICAGVLVWKPRMLWFIGPLLAAIVLIQLLGGVFKPLADGNKAKRRGGPKIRKPPR